MGPIVLLAIGTLTIAAGGLAFLAARSRASRPAPPAGGRLAPCPDAPNCVTSLAADATHTVPPIRFDGDADAAWRRLRSLVAAHPGARRIAERPGYLHFEFRSPFFGFVDDAEFLLDATNRRIDVRSAARVGWSDLGANRRRMTVIARLFNAPTSSLALDIPP